MTVQRQESSFLNYMICYFALVPLVSVSKNLSKLWLAFIERYGLLNTLHYFTQIKEKLS